MVWTYSTTLVCFWSHFATARLGRTWLPLAVNCKVCCTCRVDVPVGRYWWRDLNHLHDGETIVWRSGRFRTYRGLLRVGLCLLSETNRIPLVGVVFIVSVPDVFTAACYTEACKGKAIHVQGLLQVHKVPGSWGFQISRQSAHEGGKVVSTDKRLSRL